MGLTVTTVGSEKNLTKHELKKHAATIHCSNTFSLLQRKISNALLYHAYGELLQKEEHEISIRQLCKLIEYSGNNHGAIKEALKGLLSTVIEWNVVNDTTGVEDWTASSILASVSLQGPLCYFAYSPRMKQLLHSPSMFGKINLYIQSRFKSSYGLALYENCIRYRGLPHTKWFEIEVFRKLMGVPAGNYTIFRDFKKRVLDKSVEEVNTYSDLLVEVELMRERRQVVRVRFILKERVKKTRLGTIIQHEELLDSSQTQMTQLCSKMIMEFGLSPSQAEQALSRYDETFILEKIAVVEASKNYQSGKVKNLAAYFMSALKNDYKLPKKSSDSQRQKKREAELAKANLKELQHNAEMIETAYAEYREELIDETIVLLDETKQKRFMEMFFQYAEGSIKTILKLQRKKYSQATILKSPQIKGLLREFALRTLPELQAKLLPVEKYLDQFPEAQRNAWYQYKLIESHQRIC